MRSVLTDLVHLLLAMPLYVLLGLAWATWRAYRVKAGRWHRWRHALVLLWALVYLVSIPATANTLLAQLEARWPVPTDAQLKALPGPDGPRMLVLTAGWFRKTDTGYTVVMGAPSWERTEKAVELHQRFGGRLMFTGAPLPDGSDSVAQHMASAAQRLGVPASAIGVETRSINTHENLLFSERQFGLRAQGKVLLLTSAIHLPRSVAAARGVGLDVLPYPCDFRADTALKWQHFVPSNEAPGALEEVLHEWLGLAMYSLRGWV
jgi:uncharacterized SAM-binding protein YcdF (DUF218 family)